VSAPEYPIGTLDQILAIPEEALPRFIAELPQILGEMRQTRDVLAALHQMIGTDVELRVMDPIWVDDDADTFGVRLSTTEGEELFSANAKRAS